MLNDIPVTITHIKGKSRIGFPYSDKIYRNGSKVNSDIIHEFRLHYLLSSYYGDDLCQVFTFKDWCSENKTYHDTTEIIIKRNGLYDPWYIKEIKWGMPNEKNYRHHTL